MNTEPSKSVFVGCFSFYPRHRLTKKYIIKKYADEKVGVFCKRNGKPDVIEYIELSEEMRNSKNEKGAHKDRHENFGFGNVGFNTLLNVIYNERLENVPKILETPYVDKDYPPYKYEIEMIRNKKFDENLIEKIKGQM